MKQHSNNRTALVFGATGLVGNYLLNQLAKLDVYSKILVFSRREPSVKDKKIEVIIDNLKSPDNISELIKGDDLFCCLGTTIKKAGSREVFRQIDLDLPVKLSQLASSNQVGNFAVISSLGASSASKNFYLQVKGQMENEVTKQHFKNIIIVRPSLLLGKREEFRFGEYIARHLLPLFIPFLRGRLRKYRPVRGFTVARAMISLTLYPENKTIYESDELIEAAGRLSS